MTAAPSSPVLHLPTERECALLLVRAVEQRDKARTAKGYKPLTRARLTLPTLRRVVGRPRLAPEFLSGVRDWLLVAGWALFEAGPYWAMVRLSAVENWPRLSDTGIDLAAVRDGTYRFDADEKLLFDAATKPHKGDGDDADAAGSDDE